MHSDVSFAATGVTREDAAGALMIRDLSPTMGPRDVRGAAAQATACRRCALCWQTCGGVASVATSQMVLQEGLHGRLMAKTLVMIGSALCARPDLPRFRQVWSRRS